MASHSDIFKEIIQKIPTRDSIYNLIGDLQNLEELSYGKDSMAFTEKYDEINTIYDNMLLSGIVEEEKSSDNIVAYRLFIQEFIKYLQEINTVSVTLAFKPDDEFIQGLYHFLKMSFNFTFCLDMHYDKDIGAGLILEYQGKYLDLSLRKKVETYLETNKEYVFSSL